MLYTMESFTGISNVPDFTTENLMESSIAPADENLLIAGCRAVAENERNYNRLVEAYTIQELNYLAETGEELVTEGAFSSFFESVKAFFKKVWEKIQSIVKSALMYFNKMSMSDKEFYNKYKNDISKAQSKNLSEIDVSIYKYIFYSGDESKFTKALQVAVSTDSLGNFNTSDAVDDVVNLTMAALAKVGGADSIANDNDKALGDAEKRIDDYISKELSQDKIDDVNDEFRGAVLAAAGGKGGKYTASEFATDLKELFQGGDSAKDTVTLSEALNLVKDGGYLSNSAKIKKALDRTLKESNKGIQDAIKFVEKCQKECDNIIKTNDSAYTKKLAGRTHTVCAKVISVLKEAKNTNTQYVSIATACMKDASRQAKAIMVKAINAKSPKNESSFIQTESGSILDGIRFE